MAKLNLFPKIFRILCVPRVVDYLSPAFVCTLTYNYCVDFASIYRLYNCASILES